MGMPGWAMALAVPFGLDKFVVEPAANAYGMYKGIRDDIREGGDSDQMRADLSSIYDNPSKYDFNPGKYNNPEKALERAQKVKGYRTDVLTERSRPFLQSLDDFQRKYRDATGGLDPKYLYDPELRKVLTEKGVNIPDPGDNPVSVKALQDFVRNMGSEQTLGNVIGSVQQGKPVNPSELAQFLREGGDKSTNQLKSLIDLGKHTNDMEKMNNIQMLLNAAGQAGYGDSPQLNALYQAAGRGVSVDELDKVAKSLGVVKELKDIEVGTGNGDQKVKVWGNPRLGTIQGEIGSPYRPSAPRVTVNNYVKAYEDERGKLAAKDVDSMVQDAKAARTQMNNLRAIEKLTDGIETGKLTPTGMVIAQYGKSLGVSIDPKLGAKEAAQALMGQLALQARNPGSGAGMPGAMSDADREFLVNKITPSLTQSSEGRKMLIGIHKQLANRRIDETRLAQDYISKNGRLDDGYYRELDKWSQENPMFAAKKTASQSTTKIPDNIQKKVSSSMKDGQEFTFKYQGITYSGYKKGNGLVFR